MKRMEPLSTTTSVSTGERADHEDTTQGSVTVVNVESTGEKAKSRRQGSRSVDLLEEMGGPQGIADSSIPAVVFMTVYALAGSHIEPASISALAVGLMIAILRLVRGESLRHAFSGFFGVAIAALLVRHTGRAEDFFLPGLLLNLACAAATLVSILIRWPLLGILLGRVLGGEGTAWRKDPHQLRVYSRASWIWAGVFTARFAVLLPLYLAGSVVALGIARTVTGLPVFALGVWLSYLVLKREGIVTSWREVGKQSA